MAIIHTETAAAHGRATPTQHPEAPELAIRTDVHNPNHHLWNNNGTWFIHYTVYPTPVTKQRVRKSLQTKSLEVARKRRDQLLSAFIRGDIS